MSSGHYCDGCHRAYYSCVCEGKKPAKPVEQKPDFAKLLTDIDRIARRVEAAPPETLERAMYEADLRRAKRAYEEASDAQVSE